ncbi:MAG: bifunctional fucokinase/L-fucose-1-P-guanylyltransferase [Bacteroidaceae bacterium]|nr:bifunctional fucokinase/L-fucose-1-P-guanylyltransferase [Bacteroidaceae bacterium]
MKKLLSLPPNVVGCFHDITQTTASEFFCTSDPVNCKLGSGGGTAWLLQHCHQSERPETDFYEWLAEEKRILLHAGGQSRRLPAYAPSGKILTPIPVFRWARGQHIDQSLLDLQLPLYEAIMQKAPSSLRTLIASGDVYLRATEPLQEIPEADVVCYGLWADPVLASHHGVFMISRDCPSELDFMLQKPSTQEQAKLMPTHFTLMDIGIWLLSDRAVKALMKKCAPQEKGQPLRCYDLYSEFGKALGRHPSAPDADLEGLSVAILPLPGGEFYHYGTAPEMITSSSAIQNLVKDQRLIIQQKVKQQASIFTQNSIIANAPGDSQNVWIENSYLGEGWHYSSHNIITGVPENDWQISLADGVCVDIVPIGEKSYAVRPYGYEDAFRGDIAAATTTYLNRPVAEWLVARGIAATTLGRTDDLQAANIFPVVESVAEAGKWLAWMISETPDTALSAEWVALKRISADEISNTANLRRLFRQREELRNKNLPILAHNWRKSVFYQTDLSDLAKKYVQGNLPLPEELGQDASTMIQIHDAMFRSEVNLLRREAAGGQQAGHAFSLLRNSLTESALQHKCSPRMTTCHDQIVWGRSSVRIDVAGGWTDTPPYSLLTGGNVVNLAIELNGQPPLQIYVKPCSEPVVICRSIDLGAMERIETYEELKQYNKVGSPFSIPKAALALAGFAPEFCTEDFRSLKEQLKTFGCGIEITLLSAIPAGSGLGTSSILAATVLGALSDFCGLGWDKETICNRTLILEQLLTTGGGWQDQYGGVLHGVKLLQTVPGFHQNATVRWLPETLFTHPEYKRCHLLYYTGITRTAKHILAEIVRGMFLNNSRHLGLLDEMKQHALQMFETIQRNDFEHYGKLLRTTWIQNKALDAGTNPPAIEQICQAIDDLCLGYKLPGAGGGGFMYMLAKDEEAALRIRNILSTNPPAPNARFVEMTISQKGLQISRS